MKYNLPKVELKLLKLTPDRLKTIRPTKVLDVRESNAGTYHPDGLFSIDTFGPLGSPERNTKFSYIKIHTKVFHPKYYKELIRLKALYAGILTSKTYAIFDEEEKDFISADSITGNTGFSFFLKHWTKLEFKRNSSRQRNLRIDFLEKYRDSCMYSEILVLPAGLRDIVENEDGRDTEGEVNEWYRRIIGASNSIASQSDTNSPLLDTSRASIQAAFNNIYDFFNGVLKGKKGFIAYKWARRGVATTTRSVITSIRTGNPELGSKKSIGYNQTAVGLFQACKSYEPLVAHAVLNYTNTKFSNNGANLVDTNTLQRAVATLNNDTVDLWTTPAGITKLIDRFADEGFRRQPVKIEDNYYLALVWKGTINGIKCFKIVEDKNDVPHELQSKGIIKPITYTELFYLVRLNDWEKDVYFNTRYPITGEGSIYPSLCYLRTTVDNELRYGVTPDWQIDESRVAHVYPIMETKNIRYLDSLSVHPSRLEGMGGDHDGDKTSSLSIFTDDAREQVYDYLNSPKAYVDGDGRLLADPYVESVNRVLINITR